MIDFSNSNKKAKIYWLLFGFFAFVWILFCCNYLSNYAYRYPVIQNCRILFSKTIPNLLFPTLSLIIALFCLKNRKLMLSLICECAFIIILPFVWLNSTGEILYTPAVCSRTEDPSNYGQYDEKVKELIDLNGKEYLPETIPNDAKNVCYYYLYEKASADTIYISVTWECADGEIQKLQSKYATSLWEQYDNRKKAVYLSEKTPSGEIQPCLHAVIVIDEVSNIVTHIMANKKELLP